MNNLMERVFLALVLLLSLSTSGVVTAASVTYQFEQSSDGAILGYLEFASPPASATSAWSTSTATDVLSFQFDSGSGLASISLTNPSITSAINSTDGSTLDLGTFNTNFAGLPNWLLTFATPGLDTASYVIMGPSTNFQGNWVVSSVPVPAALWLFGSGLIGLLGVARHKR